ncbi:MAG: AMP-binding protein [Pseudomonadota bacterium]
MVIGDFLKDTASRRPDRTALVFGKHRFTYQEADRRSNQLARALLACGIKTGDRVAIFNTESHRSLEIIFGSIKIGAAFVPLNYRMSENELAYILRDCTPAALFYGRRYEDLVRQAAKNAPAPGTMVCLDEAGPGRLDYEAFIEPHSPRAPEVSFPETALAMILYTSGTTGPPKGVIFTHKKLVYREVHGRKIPGEEEGLTMKVLLTVPLFHIPGIQTCLKSVHSAATLVVLPQFDPVTFFKTVAEEKPGIATLVPTMIKMITTHPDFSHYDLSSLFLIIYGGAPMPLTTILPAMKKMPQTMFIGTYGMTEASGTSLSHLDHLPKEGVKDDEIPPRLVSVGKVVPGMEIKIADEKGAALPTGGVGEVLLKGKGIFDGYWGASEEEMARNIENGWFHTGDAGYLDEEGYLYISGRLKELIIRGGENISPLEVETVVNDHPEVANCAVIGLPDETWGERVAAVVQLKMGSRLSPEELTEFCRPRLAGFKRPEKIIFTESLPLGPTGKVLKKEVIKKYLET